MKPLVIQFPPVSRVTFSGLGVK